MVEYTLVLEIGQSNASPVGDIQGWEDKHPELAIRSPSIDRSQAKQFSTGSYRDDFTLAATFKGGPQVGDDGLVFGGKINGSWQTVNLRGVAVDAVRVATFYNPIGTLQTNGGYARSWPGTYNVVPTADATVPNTARDFTTNFIVQPGRQGDTATGVAGDEVTTGAPSEFVLNDIVVFTSTTGLDLPSKGPYRVTAVSGSTFDIETWPEGDAVDVDPPTSGESVKVHKVNDLDAPWLITRKRTGSTHTYAPTGLGNTGGSRLVVDPPFVPAPNDEEEFTVDMLLQRDAADASSPLVFDAFFGGQVEGKYEVATASSNWAPGLDLEIVQSRMYPLRAGRAVQMTPPNTVVWPTRQPEVEVSPLLTSGQTLTDTLTIKLARGFIEGEKIRLTYATSDFPTGLPAGDYLVDAVAAAAGAEGLTLTELNGTSTAYTWTGEEQPVVERIDAYTMWFVSDTRGGEERARTSVASTAVAWLPAARFVGSVSGLRLRCVAGANLGQWKHGKHVSYDGTPGLSQVHFDGSWGSTPTKNDRFVFEPTPVGDQDRPFEKFCQLLPWAPFEGLARGARETGTVPVTIDNNDPTNPIVSSGLFAPDRTSVQFFTTGELPNGLIPGKTYYTTKAQSSGVFISDTYGGANLMQTTDVESGTHYAQTVDNDNGFNPHPPGFNYPSQFALPRRYMPFDGYVAGSYYGEQVSQQAGGITAGMQLAFALYSYTGRRSLYVPLAVGGTSIGHKEVHPTGDGLTFGWFDANQQISWAPGEVNGCFARLEDVLDGVKLALTEEGSTIKDVVVHFNQGEEDARIEYMSANYRQNLSRLKKAVRQALYDRGLAPVKADRIKWLHATIRETLEIWPYAKTVNAAIEAEAQADPYSRSLVGTDLKVHAERDVFVGNPDVDVFHYHGAEMDTLGNRAFAAFKALERSGYNEIEICNMALANIGEPSKVTSIDPPDGSREAELCAQFFTTARDQMLEKHAWDFALRSATLTVRASSPRVDWKYAYDYPEDVVSVLTVVRSDVNYNYKTMGSTGQQPYSVERDTDGSRMLLTDQQDALLLYVASVEDSTMWSSLFVRALSWQLASHLAGPVLKGEDGMKMIRLCESMAVHTFRQATKHDGDHKRDVEISDHVPTWQRHRSNRGWSL